MKFDCFLAGCCIACECAYPP